MEYNFVKSKKENLKKKEIESSAKKENDNFDNIDDLSCILGGENCEIKSKILLMIFNLRY